VLEAAAALAVQQLADERTRLVSALGDEEDWVVLPASLKAGARPRRAAPRLRARKEMTCAHAARRQTELQPHTSACWLGMLCGMLAGRPASRLRPSGRLLR